MIFQQDGKGDTWLPTPWREPDPPAKLVLQVPDGKLLAGLMTIGTCNAAHSG